LGIVSVVLVFRIGRILLFDLDRLTEWGYGYLTGITIALLLAILGVVWTGKKTYFK